MPTSTPGDVPTVKTAFTSYTYQNAGHTDVTATLTAAQLAAIKAVEVPLIVVQDTAGINHRCGDLGLQSSPTAPSISSPPARC